MNSLASYIKPNIGNYMKYDTAGGRKASLVDFLRIYFSDKKGRGEEARREDKEVRSSEADEDDNYNSYGHNYDSNFDRSKRRRVSRTVTLADLLPKRKDVYN
jgi:hypothetical protein